MDSKLKALKKEVEALIGHEIGTVYGPSTVESIYKDPESGELYVHLKEFGEEDYVVKLRNWEDLIQ